MGNHLNIKLIMKSNFFIDNNSITKDLSTIDTNSITSYEYKGIIKLDIKSNNYVFPILNFFTSIAFILMMLMINIFKSGGVKKNIESFPTHPFPSFYSLNEIQPIIYYLSIFAICISGILNVWFFCSLLIQRFSVPELTTSKANAHLMFIYGIFSNIIFAFYGFSHEILKIEVNILKYLNISLTMIIYSTFIFFNIFFAVLALNVLINFKNKIVPNDKKLKKNIRVKKYLVFLAIFILFIYISGTTINFYLKHDYSYNNKNKKKFKNLIDTVNTLLFILPYVMFLLNSTINLTYYHDIIYLEEVINIIVDREFFLATDESNPLNKLNI